MIVYVVRHFLHPPVSFIFNKTCKVSGSNFTRYKTCARLYTILGISSSLFAPVVKYIHLIVRGTSFVYYSYSLLQKTHILLHPWVRYQSSSAPSSQLSSSASSSALLMMCPTSAYLCSCSCSAGPAVFRATARVMERFRSAYASCKRTQHSADRRSRQEI
ncbi:hypothetical protein DFH11DRAFT_77800 [Phellopilus nigrolimitatus]|nr:hypothetical protein DFH11DRAFT_77800 [Phellopilus nigrolimitatus]